MSVKVVAALCSALFVFVGLAAADGGQAAKPPKKLKAGVYAHFATTEGDFTVKLFDRDAPKTVANFTGLAEGTIDPANGKPGKSKPFYDGLTFHRVLKDFMIQGGDPVGNGTGGPGYKFADEISPKRKFSKPGLLAMANAGPNTNGSQFMIMLAEAEWMNGKHTIFGEVVDGMDVVKAIGNVRTLPGDKPATPIVIKTISIERVGQ
jgi:peptidyl-prolyl cis-trans isomerase A (cyclophilin A)